jgi:hypothetical protein
VRAAARHREGHSYGQRPRVKFTWSIMVMKKRMGVYILSTIVLSLIALGTWGWLKALTNYAEAPAGVYNSSNLVNAYWEYKSKHGTWPAPGEMPGYGDSLFVATFPNAAGGGRQDIYSFWRSTHIVIHIDGSDVVYATIE